MGGFDLNEYKATTAQVGLRKGRAAAPGKLPGDLPTPISIGKPWSPTDAELMPTPFPPFLPTSSPWELRVAASSWELNLAPPRPHASSRLLHSGASGIQEPVNSPERMPGTS